MSEHWKDWRVYRLRAYDNDGQSLLQTDEAVFGESPQFESWIIHGQLCLVNYKAGSIAARTVAKCPVPDTVEEAVAWLRMVAAMHGGKTNDVG